MTDWIDAESFGCVGNAGSQQGYGEDCTTRLQAAIAAASAQAASNGMGAGARVRIGPGRFRITNTIDILASQGCCGFTLEGSSSGHSGMGGATQILWDSPDPTKPAIRINSRDCIVRGISVGPLAGRTLYAGFEETQESAPGGNICSTNLFEHTVVSSLYGPGTTLINGWIHGSRRSDGAWPADCENTTWRYCSVFSFTQNGIWCPNLGGQAKNCSIERCNLVGGTSANEKVGVNWATGGVTLSHCDLQWSDVGVRAGALDQLSIENCLSEACGRLLVAGGIWAGGSNAQIRGGRFACDRLAADGQYIQFQGGGSLLLDGVFIDPTLLPAFGVSAYNTMPHPASVTAIGCYFPNMSPVLDPRAQWPGFTYGQQLTMIGCTGTSAMGPSPIPFTNELRQGP